VIGVSSWVVYARIVRGAALSLREREFVQAAQALGSRDGRILLRHVLPNVFTPWLVVATLDMARVIVIESALSFLGLGVQPPTPTWGGMLADGRVYISTAWWLATFPGLAILVTVLGINLFGDGLRARGPARLRGLVQLVEERPADSDEEGEPGRASRGEPALPRERHEPEGGQHRVLGDVRGFADDRMDGVELGRREARQEPPEQGLEHAAGVLRAEVAGGEPHDHRHPDERGQPKGEPLHVAMI